MITTNQKVKFAIDLVPDTALISRAPYWMALLELRELKAQIQELLEHSSHYGAL